MTDAADALAAPLVAPAQERIADAIRAIASDDPEAIAIEHGRRRLTYSALLDEWARSEELLRQAGAASGDLVGVTHDRGVDLVVAMLAVLGAEMRLLTLDPQLPRERRLEMAEQAGVAFSVGPRGMTSEERENAVAAEDGAYVFFTSGSTGTPNAVLGTGAGLAHFLHWQRDEFSVGPGDRCAQLTALSFDVVLRDVLLPLVSGATLVIPDRGLSPSEVVPWLTAQRISVLHTVPSLARAWTEGLAPVERGPRYAFFAGEPLTDTLVERWRRLTATECVVNLYGPTETTLAKCAYRVPADPRPGVQPVGRPLPQTQIAILDQDRIPLPPESEGEVAIRTPFRTLGYIRDGGLARERFIANPCRDDPDDLLFLTGDRGELDERGALTVRGRLDDQVKVRGVRIEPAEVAAVLEAAPGVAEAAVSSRTTPDGETELLAFFVPEGGEEPSDAGLRLALLERLPAAALPSSFQRLSHLPLLPNGKLDRLALPMPEECAASLTPQVDGDLAEIWSEVLGSASATEDDDFFALGGNSLSAARLLAEIRKRMDVEITVRALFDNPTLGGLGELIAREKASGSAPLLPPIERGDR
jgi:amino acid adenylation domain-containing protein